VHAAVLCGAVENVAYGKESWINNRRQRKRHVHDTRRRAHWTHAHSSATSHAHSTSSATSSATSPALSSCTVLDNFYVEQPVWVVDLGAEMQVSGVVIVTWPGRTTGANIH